MFLEDWHSIPMINEYPAGDVASEAMDGAAPESGQEDPLREERHLQGAACTNYSCSFYCSCAGHCVA